jgi:hypothetical protein
VLDGVEAAGDIRQRDAVERPGLQAADVFRNGEAARVLRHSARALTAPIERKLMKETQTGRWSRGGELEHDPETHPLGFAPDRWQPVFAKRSCSSKELARRSIQSETIAH